MKKGASGEMSCFPDPKKGVSSNSKMEFEETFELRFHLYLLQFQKKKKKKIPSPIGNRITIAIAFASAHQRIPKY